MIKFIKKMYKIDRGILWFIALELLLMIFSLTSAFLSPLVYEKYIDECLVERKMDQLLLVITLSICFWTLDSGALFLRNYAEKGKFSKLRISIAKDLLMKSLRKDKRFSAMDLKDRIENEIYYVKLKKIIIETLYRYILVIGSLAFMLSINIWFTIIAILSIPLAKFVLKIVQKRMVKYSSEYRNVFVEYENWLVQCINNRDSIKVNGYERNVETAFLKRWKNLSKLYMKKQICFVSQYCLNQFKDTYIIKLNLYFLGILFISRGYISVGVLLAFMKYYEKCVSTLAEINELSANGENIKPYIDKVDELYEDERDFFTDIEQEDTNIFLNKVDVIFDEVSVLRNVNLKIPNRKHLLITGESGVGKTTLLNVLAGIQKTTAGEMIIGRQSIYNLSYEQLSSLRSLVYQDSYFFKLSVMENFRLANRKITDEQIVDICKKTGCHSFIESTSEKYNTVIDRNFSVGQLQRLAIARAFMQDTPIMLFDEPTSALDRENELAFINILDEFTKEKTVVIVSHTLPLNRYDKFVLGGN